MEIAWDPAKQRRLRALRGIDLEEIRGLIEAEKFVAILENKKRPDQVLIVLEYKAYMHVVAVKLEPRRMIIKTCYPSRKADKKYKGGENEKA